MYFYRCWRVRGKVTLSTYEKPKQPDKKSDNNSNCSSFDVSELFEPQRQAGFNGVEVEHIGRNTYNLSNISIHDPTTSSEKPEIGPLIGKLGSSSGGEALDSKTGVKMENGFGYNFAVSPFLSANAGAKSMPLQGKGLREAALISQGDPYSGTPLGISGKLAKNIHDSFGIDASKLSLRESLEVSKMGARATAQGSVIRFAPGEFRPDTYEGLGILGHELAHVREQALGHVHAPGDSVFKDTAHEMLSDRDGAAFASGALHGVESVSLVGVDAEHMPVQRQESTETTQKSEPEILTPEKIRKTFTPKWEAVITDLLGSPIHIFKIANDDTIVTGLYDLIDPKTLITYNEVAYFAMEGGHLILDKKGDTHVGFKFLNKEELERALLYNFDLMLRALPDADDILSVAPDIFNLLYAISNALQRTPVTDDRWYYKQNLRSRFKEATLEARVLLIITKPNTAVATGKLPLNMKPKCPDACYDSDDKIYMHYDRDSGEMLIRDGKIVVRDGETFFHECGHRIDFNSGPWDNHSKSFVANDSTFRTLLVEDFHTKLAEAAKDLHKERSAAGGSTDFSVDPKVFLKAEAWFGDNYDIYNTLFTNIYDTLDSSLDSSSLSSVSDIYIVGFPLFVASEEPLRIAGRLNK